MQSLFLIIFLFLGHNILRDHVTNVLYTGAISYRLAGLVVVAIILETIGSYWKLRAMKERYGTHVQSNWLLFGLIAHCLVGIMLRFTAGAAINGTGFDGIDKGYQIVMLFPLIEVLRHLITPIVISLKLEDNLPKLPRRKVVSADIFLAFRAAVSFTCTRSAMVSNPSTSIPMDNIPLLIIYTICTIIIFAMFYIPANFITLLERSYPTDKKIQIGRIISLILVIIFALFPLYT